MAGLTGAGAAVGATAGAWAGGGLSATGGATGGTLVAPGVGTIGGGVLSAEAGAAGGALVGGGLGAGAGYLLGNIVFSSSTGGGGGGEGLTPGARRKLGNLANRASERVRDVIRSRVALAQTSIRPVSGLTKRLAKQHKPRRMVIRPQKPQ